MSLGEKIQQLRKASGLSQEQLAEMIGVSRQAISKWETDQSSPEIEKVVLICKTFSISTDELLGNETLVKDESSPQLVDVLQSNIKKRQFTIGWITVIVGLVFLIIEYFSLRIIQFYAMKLDLEYASGIGFHSNPMEYASVEPMPTIFKITVAIILFGLGLITYSLISTKKRTTHS